MLSPSVIFHSHSRLDNIFSGCGRTIEQTLRDCLEGRTKPENIPHICVLQLPPLEGVPDAPRFVSLNNRRLYVFKELQRVGRLVGGVIPVRIRPSNKKETEKYRKQTLVCQARIKRGPGEGGAGEKALGGCGGVEAQIKHHVEE